MIFHITIVRSDQTMGKELATIRRMSIEDRRTLIAKELLKSVGINSNQLKLKGQGAYNTVFKGPHPDPAVNPGIVALRVASGIKEEIENEKYTAIELAKLKPKNWGQLREKFSAFAKALCVPNADVHQKYVKQAKYYKKYLNIPELYKEFSEDDVRKILEAKYRGKPEQDSILDILWPHDPQDPKVAYIFISPLAEGDIWNLFREKTEDGMELKKRIENIRKAANGVLKALVTLHAKGRLHLDIKPDNIFPCVNEKGKTIMQLGDFGLLDVKTTPNNDQRIEKGEIDDAGFPEGGVEEKHSPIGAPTSANSANVRWKVTSWYKAPEQTAQKPLDLKQMTKIDIYALGASLLIMYNAAKTNADSANETAYMSDGIQPLLKNIPRYMEDVDKDNRTATLPEVRKAEYELLDLIRCMTCDDPDDRPSASECLKHRFVRMKLGA